MIELVTAKEFAEMWAKVNELQERTLRHTKSIQELKKKLKEGVGE